MTAFECIGLSLYIVEGPFRYGATVEINEQYIKDIAKDYKMQLEQSYEDEYEESSDDNDKIEHSSDSDYRVPTEEDLELANLQKAIIESKKMQESKMRQQKMRQQKLRQQTMQRSKKQRSQTINDESDIELIEEKSTIKDPLIETMNRINSLVHFKGVPGATDLFQATLSKC